MKVRMGFVSNSSSSSFMLVGIVLDEDWNKKPAVERYNFMMNEYDLCSDSVKKYLDEAQEELENNGVTERFEGLISDYWYEFAYGAEYSILTNSEQGGIDGKTVVGKEVASWDDSGDSADAVLSINEMNKIGNDIKERFNVDGEVKVILGTTY